jgi:DNA-binding FadR family transcriptional regulator
MMGFKPVDKVLISDGIIEQIKGSIMAGTLEPGQKLPSETMLASQMKVGRSTLREALQVLIHLGFIERRHKETFVSPSVKENLLVKDILQSYQAHKNIMEMIEVRKVIESFLAESAAIRADEKVLELLRQDLEAMDRSTGDVKAFIGHNHAFHIHIAEGAQNRVFYQLMTGLRDILKSNQEMVLLRSEAIHPRSMAFHRKIYKAILEKKPRLARRYMAEHINDIEKEMYHILATESGVSRKP